MPILRLVALSVLLGTSACAPIKPGADPVTQVEGTALGLSEKTAQWPDRKWWAHYQDSQLNQLIDEALTGSPTLVAAQARLAQANANVAQAQAPLRPRADANYTLTRERLSENYAYPPPLGGSYASDNRLALDFSYEMDFWGKNRAALNAAVSQQEAASAETQAARNLLINAVIQSYFNLQNAYAQEQILQDTIRQRTEVLQLTKDRYDAGLDTQVDIKQAESALAAVKVSLTQNETTIAQLRNQLAALVGAGPERGQTLHQATLTESTQTVPSFIALDLLGRRPDVVAARWRASAVQHQIDVAKAAFYPNINLVGFIGFQAFGTSQLLKSDSRMLGFGPAISLPIFHGGELNANLAERRAEADLAVANYNQAVLDAIHQVADTLAALRLLEQEKIEQKQARSAIEAAYDLAVERYRLGLGNYLVVLAAQTDVLTQQRLDTDLRIRAYQLDASLNYVLGGGYGPDENGTETTPSYPQP